MPPTLVRLTHRALEGEPAAPSNAFSVTTQGRAMTSGRQEQSSPSLSILCGHPRHYRTTPSTVSTSRCCWSARGQDIATTTTVPRTGPPLTHPRIGPRLWPDDQPLRRYPRICSCTSTGHATTPRLEQDSPGQPSAP
jgi:hypothetical protein